MDSNTKSELIQAAVEAAGAVGKELFVRRKDRQFMEQKAQYEKEIAQLRSGQAPNSTAEEESDPVVSSLSEAADVAEQYEQLLSRAEAEEDCELCRSLISSARELPLAKQQEVVPQLRDFLASVEDDAQRPELVAEINSSPALKDLMKRHMNAVSASSPSDGSTSQRERDSPPENTASLSEGRQTNLF